MRFFTDDIPWKAKAFISLVILFGFATLTYCLYSALIFPDLTWLFVAGIAVIGSLVPIGIPFAKGKAQSITITASDIFVFAAMILYSPEIAVCVALVDGVLGSLKIKRFYRIAFNLSQLSIATFVTGQVFYLMHKQLFPDVAFDITAAWVLFVGLGLCAVLYFVLNSGSISLAIALTTRNRWLDVWRENFRWALLTNLAGASAAVFIVLNFNRTQFFSFGIAIPVVLVIYHAYRMNHQRVETQQEAQRFQATLDALSSQVALLDDTGTIISVNAVWRQFTEKNQLYGEAYGVGSNFLQACEIHSRNSADEIPALVAGVREVISKRKNEFFLEYPYHNAGEQRWYAVRVTRFRGDGPARVVVAQDDITQRKRAEEALRASEMQLRQSQKMEAIGGLAGGIAHDFNNLLMVILGYTQFIAGSTDEEDPIREAVEEIKKAGEQAATLTRQLLTFSRTDVAQEECMDLNQVVADMERMLQRVIGEDIHLSSMLGPALAHVKADETQIEQILMNLAVNARDAMPEGGQLVIETETVTLDEISCQLKEGLKPGPYVMLSVSDTGHGMNKNTLNRIFEPFFTTKEVGKGTGLGLSTTYGIVQQSGGQILVFSDPEIGTTFKIMLPEVARGTASHTPERVSTEVPGGSETVLLVEDEEPVRRLARMMLERLGYRVLEAADGDNAMTISDQYKDDIHLLFTDVVMPHLRGYQVAECLAENRPEMKVLYMSGYTRNALHHNGKLEASIALLSKPFTLPLLAGKIREVLEAADPGAGLDSEVHCAIGH